MSVAWLATSKRIENVRFTALSSVTRAKTKNHN